MVVRLGVEPAALAAFDDHAMRIAMGDVYKELGLARAAPIGLVAAALAQGLAGDVRFDRGAAGVRRINQDHVELRHDGISDLAPSNDIGRT